MSTSAHVASLAVLQSFKAALIKFMEESRDALMMLNMELQRASDWLQHDRPHYWKHQVTVGWTRVSEARVELELCQMRKVDGQATGCQDEKKALEKAKRDVRHAEEMIEVVRGWCQKMQRETLDYEAHLSHLESACDIGVPKALAALERIMSSLEAYSAVQAPTMEAAAIDRTGGDANVRRQTSSDVVRTEQKPNNQTDDELPAVGDDPAGSS